SDGGTLSQNIYTGLFKSFSQQGMDDFPSAYTFDQAGADRFFIEMGNFQSAKWNLDFFFDVMKAQLKLSGQFQGLSKSYNAYNGADASDQPDIGGTSMMAQTIMAYEKSTGDKKYHLLLTESIKWLLKVQKENGGKALPDTPGGHLFNPEPNAIAFAALHNFGTIYNDKDALLAADQIRQWAAGLWDKENFLIKSPNGNYPADNNTRWLQALGPKAFMETFLDNDPVKLGKFLRAMEKTFGVTVINYHTGQTVHLLDLADQQKADGRLTNDQHTPNHRIGFPEVTAEFLQGLIDSRPYLTREDAAFADQLIAKYSGQLQAMTDRNGNLPQATDKGKDSGYNGLTILGNHSLASGVQYQFMVLGLDPLHLDGPRGNALGLKPDKIEIPPVLSFNTLNQGAVIKPGETNYLQMSRYFNQLIIDEHAHHNRNLIYHDPINNLHFVYINTADHIVDARLIPSPKEIQKQVVLAGEDAQMTALKSQALNGQGAFPHGGVIFQTPDGKRLGMLRGVEGQSDAVEDVLSAVGQLPVQEQSFINYKGFSNFMLHNYKVDGVHQDVMVTVVFPLHKSIVHDVKDDHNVITTSIYEGGRLRFIINDNTTTVMNYDDATGVESTTTSYHNFAGGREAMVKMLSDSSKPLAERQALFNGQHPSNKTTTVWAGYIDPTLSMDRVDPNEVWIIKRSTNLDTGHVTTQGYGLFTRPVWEADQFTVTENHFDQSGSFTHAEQFQNTGTLQTPQKGQELFEIKVLDPNEIKGLPQQFTEKQQQAHQSLVYKKDVIHGTESLMVMDNENYGRYTAKYTADQFTNPEGQTSKLSTVLIPEYRPDFMGGQVPYVTREYSGAGKLMKESLTISIDAVTQVTTVQEKNMRTGEVIEKNIEPLFGNSLTESKMDSLGRQEIVSNVYSNDYLHVSSTTVIGGTLAVETKGTYNQAAQQWTLEQTRWNYSRNAQQEKVPVKYETVRSVLSAGGHLIYEDTMFPQNVYEINGHTYTENDRRFIPEYDVNGNISRSTEGIIANGVFTPKEIMEYSDYGDFFAARQSFTKRIINGKEIIYSTSRLLTTPAEYQKSGKLRFEVTSKVYDKADDPATWIETTDRDGHLVEKSLQVYDGQNLVGEQVTSFSNFNVQNIPAQSTTFIRQGAANEVLSTSIDKTSLEEARLGLERTEITNQFNGLVRQELRDRRGRVIENDIEGVDPVTGRQEVQRKTVFYNFNEFDIAVDSVTKSLLEGTFTPYTTSKLLSDYNDILTNHSIRFHVHNDFLSSTANSVDWQEVKDYHGHVIELDKGHMNPNGQFEATRKITSTYQGIPGLIDVANSTRTVMVIDGKPGLLTDQSHLITAHGVTIDAHNINTIPAQDIFNGVHKVRYQGISYFTELEGMTSTDRDYQEIRNSLGNVEVTLFGTVDPQGHFNKNRSLYRVYGTTENNFSNFDIAKATVTTVGDKGHEEVVSYSNNTHITDDDRYLIYKTKKGLGAQGLVLTNDVFANLGAITAQVSGPEHQLDLTHLTETISQVKDSEGRVIFTFSGFPSLNINGFGTGNPVFVTVNQYQENRISQPVAAHSQTYFWKKAMGDYDPTDNFNQLKNYIHNNHPTVIASLDNLMFDKGVATYKTDDMREVGLRTVSMRLD
ncbi:MAG: hypothetical protein KGJ11_05205, partial [Candidatus Omnitrophica bacterium]|nr:hypothetical protein [Candidatus Omnitrophota bacterium]